METITLTHQDFRIFCGASNRIKYLDKWFKRGPAFALELKKRALEFGFQYCSSLFHLVESKGYVTIWFEVNQISNFPYSSNNDEQQT